MVKVPGDGGLDEMMEGKVESGRRCILVVGRAGLGAGLDEVMMIGRGMSKMSPVF